MKKLRLAICAFAAAFTVFGGESAAKPEAVAAPAPETPAAKPETPKITWQELEQRWESFRAAMDSPMENLTLPLEYFPDGRVKARLQAGKAQVFDKNTIFAENVKVELLNNDGNVEAVLTTDDCLLDRPSKQGYCRGAVKVDWGSEHIKGRGLYFSATDEFLKILSECEIRTRRFSGIKL